MSKYSSTINLLLSNSLGAFYFLGAMITDGNVYKVKINTCKSSLVSKDDDWLKDINLKLLDGEGFFRTRKNKTTHELWLYNSEIYDWLVKHECVENKSLIVKMPCIPDKYFPDFIRACIDGDGSISSCNYTKTKNNKIYNYQANVSYICSGSKDFLISIQDKLLDFGIKGSFCEVTKTISHLKDGSEIIPRNPHYRLTFSGKSCVDFLKFAYYKDHPISMARKRLKADQIISQY